MAKILVVDDEKAMVETMCLFLKKKGHEVLTAEGAKEATRLLGDGGFDVVVSDIIMPQVNGVELLGSIRELSPSSKVIMITGEPNIQTSIKAMRPGTSGQSHLKNRPPELAGEWQGRGQKGHGS